MKNKFKIGDIVLCENRRCTVIDMVGIASEYEYLIGYNEEYAEVLESDLEEIKV